MRLSASHIQEIHTGGYLDMATASGELESPCLAHVSRPLLSFSVFLIRTTLEWFLLSCDCLAMFPSLRIGDIYNWLLPQQMITIQFGRHSRLPWPSSVMCHRFPSPYSTPISLWAQTDYINHLSPTGLWVSHLRYDFEFFYFRNYRPYGFSRLIRAIL